MKIKNLPTLFIAVIVFCLCCAAPVNAQTGLLLTVNNSGDSVDAVPGDGACADSSGRCTLRAAIDEANTTSEFSAIIFDLPNPTAIDLTLGELSIQKNFDIVGPGARRLTVRRSPAPGTPNFRVFRAPAGQTSANIRGLTIQNGNDVTGGGILIESGRIVSLIDVAVRGNRAAADGGAIAVSGRLTVLRCLIESNIADNQGGAIKIFAGAPATTVTSSTFTGNTAAVGGAIHNDGDLLLVNDTISGNSASMGSSSFYSGSAGNVQILNTIIGRDLNQTVSSISGQFQTLGNNIVTDSTGSTGFTNGVNGDQVSQNNAIDPLLGSLANNGGQTDTLALLPGSPAISTGNACARTGPCPQLPGVFFQNSRDQRRFIRSPSAKALDVGAFAVSTAIISPNATFGLSFSGLGGTRHYGSIVSIIDATTLARRYALLRLNGGFSFQGLPLADAFVVEIKSKRSGMLTPFVFGLDR